MISHDLIPIAMFAMIAVTAVGVPLARGLARRLEQGGPPKLPGEVLARLERMEQAIDSIAVEVERISEGQRFTTKLLADRAGDSEAATSTRERLK
jgi:hypothetical protein